MTCPSCLLALLGRCLELQFAPHERPAPLNYGTHTGSLVLPGLSMMIARLCSARVTVVTQYVDDLHERAGSNGVIHLTAASTLQGASTAECDGMLSISAYPTLLILIPRRVAAAVTPCLAKRLIFRRAVSLPPEGSWWCHNNVYLSEITFDHSIYRLSQSQ